VALRPGDPFERALTETLIQQANRDRTRELAAAVQAAGVTAGQFIALCLGTPPEAVQQLADLFLTPPSG
jgi:hypothetical protein